MFNSMIQKAVLSSQRCQRNWDLSKRIPEEDLQVLETAITECPSKQNYVFYKPYLITNREIIDKLYHQTADGYIHEDGTENKNTQILANVVVAFEESFQWQQQIKDDNSIRNEEAQQYLKSNISPPSLDFQRTISIGIATGYLNLTASLMGYKTGCCTCFNRQTVKQILKTQNNVHLLMGIGFADPSRPRREHHKRPDLTFPTHSKNIEVQRIR